MVEYEYGTADFIRTDFQFVWEGLNPFPKTADKVTNELTELMFKQGLSPLKYDIVIKDNAGEMEDGRPYSEIIVKDQSTREVTLAITAFIAE